MNRFSAFHATWGVRIHSCVSHYIIKSGFYLNPSCNCTLLKCSVSPGLCSSKGLRCSHLTSLWPSQGSFRGHLATSPQQSSARRRTNENAVVHFFRSFVSLFHWIISCCRKVELRFSFSAENHWVCLWIKGIILRQEAKKSLKFTLNQKSGSSIIYCCCCCCSVSLRCPLLVLNPGWVSFSTSLIPVLLITPDVSVQRQDASMTFIVSDHIF